MANMNGSVTQDDAQTMPVDTAPNAVKVSTRMPYQAVSESCDADPMNTAEDIALVDAHSMEHNKHIQDMKERYPNLAKGMGRRGDKAIAAEDGRKGGYKSGITKRKRKLMRESAQLLLSADMSKLPIPEMSDIRIALQALGVDDITGADAIVLAQYVRALRGDTEAFRAIRDTSGEKPSLAVDVSASDRPIDSDSVAALSDAELAALAEGNDTAQEALPPPMLQ